MNSSRRSTLIRSLGQPARPETLDSDHQDTRNWFRVLPRATICHELISRRSAAQARATELVSRIEAVFKKEIDSNIALKARILDTVYKPPVAFSSEAALVVFELPKHNSHAVLEIELLPLVALLTLVGGEATKTTPVLTLTRLEEAGLGYLSLQALSEMRKQGYWHALWDARLLNIYTRREEVAKLVAQSDAYLAAEIEIRAAKFVGASRLFLPRVAFENVLKDIEPDVVPKVPQGLMRAQIAFSPRLGPATLEDAEFDSIQIGDVLVFDNLRKDSYAEGKCSLKGASFFLHGRLGEKGFEVEEIQTLARPKDLKMNGSTNLPIEIEIELAKVRIPLSELTSLGKGSILPLRISPHDQVVLKVGDVTFAKATLVDVEGQIGAKIVSLEG